MPPLDLVRTDLVRTTTACATGTRWKTVHWRPPPGTQQRHLDIPLDEVVHEGGHEVQVGAVVGSCKGQRKLLLGGARQR